MPVLRAVDAAQAVLRRGHPLQGLRLLPHRLPRLEVLGHPVEQLVQRQLVVRQLVQRQLVQRQLVVGLGVVRLVRILLRQLVQQQLLIITSQSVTR